MTKDRDLDVLLIWRRSDPNEGEQLSNEKQGHRTAHADDPGTFAASLVRAAFLRLHPTRDRNSGSSDWILVIFSRSSAASATTTLDRWTNDGSTVRVVREAAKKRARPKNGSRM
jgi:hypothetical protein